MQFLENRLAIKGNRFWEIRAKHGRDRLFADAESLRECILDFFTWYEENPLYSDKVGFSEGVAIHAPVAHPRAMTVRGLATYLGISVEVWHHWKNTRDDLADVLKWAENIIWNQKFSSAAAGLMKENIIARELGLAEKVDQIGNVPTILLTPPEGERPYPTPEIYKSDKTE